MRNSRLDGLRFLTALYVVIHHCLDKYVVDSVWTLPLRLGQIAVLVFFVLSGYFMHLSLEKKRNLRFLKYIRKRLLRIYPIYITAIFLPVLLALVFNTWDLLSVPFSIKTILGNLLFFQDLGRYPNVQFTTWYNAPLWSLSYEMFFYIAHFGLMRFQNYRFFEVLIIGSLISFLIYPNKLAMNGIYFIFYYIGILLARNNSYQVYLAGLFLPVIGFALMWRLGGLNTDYLILHWIAAPVLLFVFMLTRKFHSYKWLSCLSSGGMISYGIYAFHFPLMINIAELLNMEWSLLLFLIGTILTIGLSWLMEVKLHEYIKK